MLLKLAGGCLGVAAFVIGSAAQAAGPIGPQLPTAWQVDGWHPPMVLPPALTDEYALDDSEDQTADLSAPSGWED